MEVSVVSKSGEESWDEKVWVLLSHLLNGEILISSPGHPHMTLWCAVPISLCFMGRLTDPVAWECCHQQPWVVVSLDHLSCRELPQPRPCPFPGWSTSTDWRMHVYRAMAYTHGPTQNNSDGHSSTRAPYGIRWDVKWPASVLNVSLLCCFLPYCVNSKVLP